jgi:hypothetical protein
VQKKDCPSCGLEVPEVAYRCKECFHDFQSTKTTNNGPIVILGLLAVMGILGAITLGLIVSFPTNENILVHQDSQSIIFTRQYSVGPIQTERLPFKNVSAVEHVIESNGTYSVVAILTNGSRLNLNNAKRSQKGPAQNYARMMGKPWQEQDQTSGFMRGALEKQQNTQTPAP